MLISNLFEEIPIASGEINPNTGRTWLPSELRAAQSDIESDEIRRAQQAAADQAARDNEENPTQVPIATSSTAPNPTSVKYTGALLPKKKAASANFTQTSKPSYKMSGTPSVPTVPNMTQAPATVETPPETAPSAMGNMARQLSAKGQTQTSTGGATIPTGTGIRHAASPFNPNQTAGLPQDSATKTAEKIAVTDIANQVNRQMKLVKDLDDLKKIKQLIDKQFTKHGLVSESAFAKRDILIKRATQAWARRTI